MDWWGWWEADGNQMKKMPELGLNSGPLGLNSGPWALSAGHNHYTTQPHHTHTHTHTNTHTHTHTHSLTLTHSLKNYVERSCLQRLSKLFLNVQRVFTNKLGMKASP